MYKISVIQQQNFKQVKLYNEITGEYLLIAPDFGANISKLVLMANNELHSIVDGNESNDEFAGGNIFKGAKLFPFPNRIKDGKYFFKGKSYQLPINYTEENNSCHGFVFDKKFLIGEIKSGKDGALAIFYYKYEGKIEGYPFPFNLELTYYLSDKGMTCRSRVKNMSGESIPMGDGWHPFFSTGRKINKLQIRFPASYLFEADERLIPSGKKLPYSNFNEYRELKSSIFDSCFKLQPSPSGIQTTEIFDAKQNMTIQLWQEAGPNKYNYLQIYTPPNRNSIAIEPMTCIANAFNNKIKP